MRPEGAVIAGDTKREKGVLYPCMEPGASSVISNFTPYDPGLARIVRSYPRNLEIIGGECDRWKGLK